MAELGPLMVGLSDLALAMVVFLLLARPELLLGLAARRSGLGEEFDTGTLTELEEAHLLEGLVRLGGPSVLALFVWSLLSGSFIALSRL